MNLNTTVAKLIEKYGLDNTLVAITNIVRDIKGQTRDSMTACLLADIAYEVGHAAGQAGRHQVVELLNTLHGKPKVLVVVYDYAADTCRSHKFTVALRSMDEPSDLLRETQELDAASANLTLANYYNKYDVVKVITINGDKPVFH
jgi:hypothetical protein